jgi:hypothetical protein
VDSDISEEESASIFGIEVSHFNPQDGGRTFHLQDYTLQRTTILTVFLKKHERINVKWRMKGMTTVYTG